MRYNSQFSIRSSFGFGIWEIIEQINFSIESYVQYLLHKTVMPGKVGAQHVSNSSRKMPFNFIVDVEKSALPKGNERESWRTDTPPNVNMKLDEWK